MSLTTSQNTMMVHLTIRAASAPFENQFTIVIDQSDQEHENCLMDVTCKTCVTTIAADCQGKELDLQENMFEVRAALMETLRDLRTCLIITWRKHISRGAITPGYIVLSKRNS